MFFNFNFSIAILWGGEMDQFLRDFATLTVIPLFLLFVCLYQSVFYKNVNT